MGRIFRLLAMTATLGLAGCVTVSPQTQLLWSQDIDLALSSSPDRLRMLAEAGDRHAQIAYGLVLRYGLHGVPADPARADDYVARATRVLRYNTLMIWMPATKKAPGYMMPVTTPVYGYSPAQARGVDDCARLLDQAGDPPDLAGRLERGVCGGSDNYRRLKGQWHSGRMR